VDRYDMFPHIEDCMSMTLREWLLFHNVMHRHYTRYRGRKVLKPPFDWIVLGDIIEETAPGVIIEIGSYEGGTALWMADLVRALGLDCPIVSIDLADRTGGLGDPGITWIHGDATDEAVLCRVRDVAGDRRGLVIEDSDHKEHVTERLLDLYHPFVAEGCYLVVEDTLCEFTGTPPFPGPLGAVKRFVARHDAFVIDRSRERYVLTYNPMGYLLRRPAGS
jgi:cephalosporin hydroxylase